MGGGNPYGCLTVKRPPFWRLPLWAEVKRWMECLCFLFLGPFKLLKAKTTNKNNFIDRLNRNYLSFIVIFASLYVYKPRVVPVPPKKTKGGLRAFIYSLTEVVVRRELKQDPNHQAALKYLAQLPQFCRCHGLAVSWILSLGKVSKM